MQAKTNVHKSFSLVLPILLLPLLSANASATLLYEVEQHYLDGSWVKFGFETADDFVIGENTHAYYDTYFLGGELYLYSYGTLTPLDWVGPVLHESTFDAGIAFGDSPYDNWNLAAKDWGSLYASIPDNLVVTVVPTAIYFTQGSNSWSYEIPIPANYIVDTVNVTTISAVPVPTTLALLLPALVMLALVMLATKRQRSCSKMQIVMAP